jgi:hypothetical protein
MAKFTVEKGKRYRAHIELNFFEAMVGNDVIIKKLEDAGFTDVKAAGSGDARQAVGTWLHETVDGEMPEQIKRVEEI